MYFHFCETSMFKLFTGKETINSKPHACAEQFDRLTVTMSKYD